MSESDSKAAAPRVKTAGEWISVISAVVTLCLTGYNVYAKGQLDQAEFALRQRTTEFEQQVRSITTQLEQSKERTSRYGFVNGLLPNVLATDPNQRALTVNLIRLSLTDEEADRLFAGLSTSQSAQAQSLGQEGLRQIQREKSAAQMAAEKEREGFAAIAAGDYDAALTAFAAAERSFPSYHNVFEIHNLLRRERTFSSDPATRQRVVARILREYSWGIPADIRPALEQASKG